MWHALQWTNGSLIPSMSLKQIRIECVEVMLICEVSEYPLDRL